MFIRSGEGRISIETGRELKRSTAASPRRATVPRNQSAGTRSPRPRVTGFSKLGSRSTGSTGLTEPRSVTDALSSRTRSPRAPGFATTSRATLPIRTMSPGASQ